MIDATAEITDADLLKLDSAINKLIIQSGRTMEQAVDRASITFLQSARANTPKAKSKKRKISKEADRGGGRIDKRSGVFKVSEEIQGNEFISLYFQNKKRRRVLLPNPNTALKGRKMAARTARREIIKKFRPKPRVGAGQMSWNRAFGDVGKKSAVLASWRSQRINAASRARKLGGRFTPARNIINDLSYLTKIAPNLERTAIGLAGKKLLFEVNNNIEKAATRF